MRIRLAKNLRLSFTAYAPLVPQHGPQTWPWWRLVSPSAVILLKGLDCKARGIRFWFYTRWGAPHFDIFLDWRKLS